MTFVWQRVFLSCTKTFEIKYHKAVHMLLYKNFLLRNDEHVCQCGRSYLIIWIFDL